MKITKKIWLLRICTVLYTAIFCIGCVAKGGVLQDVYASSANTVLVKKTKADKNVIPDKYNTGAKGNLKKVKLGAVVGGIQFTAARGNTKNSLDFYYNNKQVKGKIIFKDYDFSEYPVVCYNSQKVEQKINVTFINCKFSYFATDRACTNVSYEFQKCTFKNFGGSNASFDRCKFGGSYNDGLNPFQKINVKNSFFCDLGSVKSDKVIHSDGTQIYGWKGITAKDILYKNCRFEIPQIAPKGSKAGVNACIMLQLEYSGAESIKFEDCILNGGGYSIYAHSISKKYPLKNIEFKNIQVGGAKTYGSIYPDVSSAVTFENAKETSTLYVGSVWKEKGKVHLSVTNDSCRKRKLLVITDQGKYSYTIPACPKGGQTDISQTYADMPFDQKIVIPQKCKYIICYDNTFSGAAEQIRFVNWQGKKVYLSQKENKNLYSKKNENITSGKCGEKIRYTLSKAGVLTLRGKGETYSYHSNKKTPWHKYSDLIKIVKVEKGITGLGNQLFKECGAIQQVSLPKELQNIGDRTFYGAVFLKRVELQKKTKYNKSTSFSGKTIVIRK